MFTIHLNKMQFFAHHGVHDEEALTGNGFEVDIAINFESNQPIHALSETINYVEVYELIKKRMDEPAKLLETLAGQIASDVRVLDDRIISISLNINKLNPPIAKFSGKVGVTLFKEF